MVMVLKVDWCYGCLVGDGMREIKFRAWDESTKEMHYIDDSVYFGLSAGDILNRFDCVMQYTGIKDTYGVDIYEGDIVVYFDGDDFKDVRAIVEFDDLTDVPDWLSWSEKIVVGNIYEI